MQETVKAYGGSDSKVNLFYTTFGLETGEDFYKFSQCSFLNSIKLREGAVLRITQSSLQSCQVFDESSQEVWMLDVRHAL